MNKWPYYGLMVGALLLAGCSKDTKPAKAPGEKTKTVKVRFESTPPGARIVSERGKNKACITPCSLELQEVEGVGVFWEGDLKKTTIGPWHEGEVFVSTLDAKPGDSAAKIEPKLPPLPEAKEAPKPQPVSFSEPAPAKPAGQLRVSTMGPFGYVDLTPGAVVPVVLGSARDFYLYPSFPTVRADGAELTMLDNRAALTFSARAGLRVGDRKEVLVAAGGQTFTFFAEVIAPLDDDVGDEEEAE